MDTDTVEQMFESIGFEIVEIDDRDVVFYELNEDGDYATVSDEDGNIPSSLEEALIISIYDEHDAFQWSVTLPNGHELKELFIRFDDTEELLQTLQEIRSENIERYDADLCE